ncbi:MAG: glycosyltransferase family 2 protein [Ilumatobacteraceae bacterium]
MENVTEFQCDVVIATRDRPDRLTRCLDGLRRQTASGFRVIVVDDSSSSPVADRVGGVSFHDLELQLVTLPQPSGPAAARNAGVSVGTGEFIVFIDDDIVADRDLIAVHLAAVTAPHDPAHPIVSCGPFVQPADWQPTPWNLWEARQAKKEADNILSGEYTMTWRLFHTGNNCVPRAMFEAVGGFNETFKRAEDDEFALRLDQAGCVFRFEPGAIAWHYSQRSLEAWLAIPQAYARYDVLIDRMNPDRNYLRDLKEERDARRRSLRAARVVLGDGVRNRIGVRLATSLASLLYRLGMVDLAMGALSVAYDASYTRGLRHAEREVRAGGDAQR